MSKKIRFLSALMALLMLISLLPTNVFAAEGVKKFTLREQTGTNDITELEMVIGEEIDLRFIGVPDYKSYSNKRWTTTNANVATISSTGVVKAVEEGTCVVNYKIGDETVYQCDGVKITVVKERKEKGPSPIYVGTSEKDIFISKTIAKGDCLELKAFCDDYTFNSNYLLDWESSDTKVATVDKHGNLTARKNGKTTIQLRVINLLNNEILKAVPVSIYVEGQGGSTTVKPSATPTPTPGSSIIPGQIVTPIPTPTPTVKPTVTPSNPSVADVKFEATVLSDTSIQVAFDRAVNFTISDFNVSNTRVSSITYNSNKTIATLNLASSLVNNMTYTVQIEGVDYLASVYVAFNTPNQIVLTYSCMGEENKAYYLDDEYFYFDVPTVLEVKLYANGVDVTETYKEDFVVTYELLSSTNDDYVELNDNELRFYAKNQRATVRATVYSWVNGDFKETYSNTVSIVSTSHVKYDIKYVEAWTIVDSNSKEKIDWSKPNHNVIADIDASYDIVLLFVDNYGYRYSTDARGVNENNKIYSVTDSKTPFASYGYELTFEGADNSKFYVTEDGELYAFNKGSNAVIRIIATDEEGRDRNFYAISFNINAERTLSGLKANTTTISVNSDALDAYKNVFCIGELEIKGFDQYSEEWKKPMNFEVSCTNKDVNSVLTSKNLAYMNGNKFVVNGEEISKYTTATTLYFNITETETNKSIRITVNIKKPNYKDNAIVISGWDLIESQTFDLAISNEEVVSKEQVLYADIFDMSKTSVKVGIKTSNIFVTQNANQKYDSTNCSVGNYYVTVLGPDGKALNLLSSTNKLGFNVDETGRVKIVFGYVNENNQMVNLKEGNYTVSVVYISEINGTRVTTKKDSATISVTNTTKKLDVKSISSSTTAQDVKSKEDVKDVIEELFTFSLDGSEWVDFNRSFIVDVEYDDYNNTYIRIKSISIAIPQDYKTAGMVANVVKLNVSKTIKYNVK